MGSRRSFDRIFGGLAISIALAVGATDPAAAADGRLYPSGPPNGVAYLRFVNLAPQDVTISSPAAKIAIPADDAHRVGEFDPVTPGTPLIGMVQLGAATKPIDLTLKANEFVTVAVTASPDGMTITVFREEPSDFNALKSSLAVFNLDQGCTGAELLAGDNHLSVISAVALGAVARRLVNPVNVELTVSCGDPAKTMPAKLGALAAGERYSVFVVGALGPGRQVVAQRDEQAPFRP
jgi:alginate O-acetyltransferase complex protein AlgF